MQYRRGFTLVELSIVLVILGLLVGGVLTGQSLIRAAQLRGVTTESQKWRTGINAFRDKYFSFPGDMTNAVAFWGPAAGSSSDNFTSSCYGTAGTGTQTCNGDGNGQTGVAYGTGNESLRFWQHLSNAGMIEGRYAGITGQTNSYPLSKYPTALWTQSYYGLFPGNPWQFAIDYGNRLDIQSPTGGYMFNAEDAWNVDTKTDDGRPGTGAIIVNAWGGCTSAADNSAASAAGATYTLSVSSPCIVGLIYRNAF